MERVEIAFEEVGGAAGVAPGQVGDLPAGGPPLHRESFEEGRAAPDHVGAEAARGQLGQVGPVGQLAEDGADRFADVDAGQ